MAVLAVFALAVTATWWWVQGQQERWLHRGLQEMADGDLGAARISLNRHLQAYPNSYPARLAMAQLARRSGHADEALIQCDICEALDGRNPAPLLERRLLEAQNGDLALDPWFWQIVANDHFETPSILEALAKGYEKNYMLHRAEYALTRLVELQPKHVEALLMRAWARERRHVYLLALEDYDQALAAQPDHDEARVRKAQLLVLIEKPAEALPELKALRPRRPDDPRVLVGLLKAYTKTGKIDEAQNTAEQLALRFPKDPDGQTERARFHLELGQALEAEALLRQVIAQAPFDYAGHFSLHQALHRQAKTEEAHKVGAVLKQLESDITQMNELTDKLQKAPFDPDLRCAIAGLFLRSGEERQAVAWYKTVLRLDRRHAATHAALAEYHERLQQHALAEYHRQWTRGKAAATSTP